VEYASDHSGTLKRKPWYLSIFIPSTEYESRDPVLYTEANPVAGQNYDSIHDLSREGGNAAKLTFMADHRSLLLS
jgi:hypothetical protein